MHRSMMHRMGFLLLPVLSALVALRCSFTTEDTMFFRQQPVSPLSLRIQVQRSIGSSITSIPHLAIAYQLYFANPVSQVVTPATRIDAFPALVIMKFSDVLPVADLNRGFALGYGNYVLGAAFIVVYDDLNGDNAYSDGEPIIGSSPNEIIIYLQGTPTQELMDQFGPLQQGYNLCVKSSQIRGVDLFQVTPAANYVAAATIPKAGTEVLLPKLR